MLYFDWFLCLTKSCYILKRGSKLDDVSAISQNLANESKKYNWGAKQLSMLVRTHNITIPLVTMSYCIGIFHRLGGSIGHQ